MHGRSQRAREHTSLMNASPSSADEPVRTAKACGVLVIREQPRLSFLLMRHPTRYDLPKGHVEPGESERDSALRELQEETGIGPEDVCIDAEFRFETSYRIPASAQSPPVQKSVVIFLGRLLRDVEIQTSEHSGFLWVDWQPPHQIQPETIDPLLAAVERSWARKREGAAPRPGEAPAEP